MALWYTYMSLTVVISLTSVREYLDSAFKQGSYKEMLADSQSMPSSAKRTCCNVPEGRSLLLAVAHEHGKITPAVKPTHFIFSLSSSPRVPRDGRRT